MEEVFHENILLTFLFCFLVSMGIIQIMAARRGWHGLSVYGGRLRSNINNAIGAGLVIFGYAWYFANPMHRNVRNIEAFMSLVCLVLGAMAAVAATAVMASLAEVLRRRFRRVEGPHHHLERLSLPWGTALVSGSWGRRGENLVIVAEPGRGSERLSRKLSLLLPEGCGMLSLHLHSYPYGPPSPDTGPARQWISAAMESIATERGVALEGEAVIGLGWGANALRAALPEFEKDYQPRSVLLVAPVIPDAEKGIVGDALLSNTPLDIFEGVYEQRPWREPSLKTMIRLWLPVLALCVAASTAVTVGFDVRWQLFSGPLVGLILSLWMSYYILRGRGDIKAGGTEEETVSKLCAPVPEAAAAPVTVLTSGDAASLETMPLEARPAAGSAGVIIWEDILRGKFLLGGGTPRRLAALIRQGRPREGVQ